MGEVAWPSLSVPGQVDGSEVSVLGILEWLLEVCLVKLVPDAPVDNLPIAAQTTLISEYVNI